MRKMYTLTEVMDEKKGVMDAAYARGFNEAKEMAVKAAKLIRIDDRPMASTIWNDACDRIIVQLKALTPTEGERS